jgi:hypothetical protein
MHRGLNNPFLRVCRFSKYFLQAKGAGGIYSKNMKESSIGEHINKKRHVLFQTTYTTTGFV